ncbi:uncharacterized protein [Diabrotica undecimpunctata]|uniref:uncharacterized protein n=1 Tax=Diabrotica undecimpunctata TaxID=50387 RepID=UPI003B631EF8
MDDYKLRRAKRKVDFESSSGSEFSDFDSDDDLNDKEYSVTESDCSTGVTHILDENESNDPSDQKQDISRGYLSFPENSTPSCWRKVHSKKRDREKTRRNLGHGYKTYQGTEMEPKAIGEPCK